MQSNPGIAEADPEELLNRIVLGLVIPEKIGILFVSLMIIWATAVLLGGFAIMMKAIDFWFVTIILLFLGARFFYRTSQLELQHDEGNDGLEVGLLSHPDATASRSISMSRKWAGWKVPIYGQALVSPSTAVLSFERAQIFAETATFIMSGFRVLYGSFDNNVSFTMPSEGTETKINQGYALSVFYILASSAPLMFILRRFFGEHIKRRRMIQQLNKGLGLQPRELGMTGRVLYEVYSTCLKQSIYIRPRMDVVDYALSYLQSDQADEQLWGLNVLLAYTKRKKVGQNTLLRIGSKQGSIERLLEMMTWNDSNQACNIQELAADLLRMIVKSSVFSFAAISGRRSIECITRLFISNTSNNSGQVRIVALKFLKYFTRDPVTSAKIPAPETIEACLFNLIKDMPSHAEELKTAVLQVKLSMQLLHKLAREDLASVNSAKMASLVDWLLNIFLQSPLEENYQTPRRAGKALYLLAQTNVDYFLDLENKVSALIAKMENQNLADIAMAILRTFFSVYRDRPSMAIVRTLYGYRDRAWRRRVVRECTIQAIMKMMMPYAENMRRRKEAISLQVAAMGFLSEVAADITEMEMVREMNGKTVAERLVELLKEAGARSVDGVGGEDQRVRGSAEQQIQMLAYMKLTALNLAIALLTHHGGIFKRDFRRFEFGGAVRRLSASDLFKTEPSAISGIAAHPVIMSVDPPSPPFDHLVNKALTAVEAE